MPIYVKRHVEGELRFYHENKRQMEAYRNELASLGATDYAKPSVQSNKISDSTACIGINLASSPYLLQTEKTIRAIDKAISTCAKTDLKLLDLIYFKGTHTPEGAGMVVGYRKTQVYERVNRILSIANDLGYIRLQ